MCRSKKLNFFLFNRLLREKNKTINREIIICNKLTHDNNAKTIPLPVCSLGIKSWKIICADQMPLNMPWGKFDR